MKNNLKRLAALLLAVILMLSLTGLGEEEIVIEDGASTEGIISEAGIEIDATTIELDSMIDIQQDPVDIGEETPPQPAQDSSEINAGSTVTLGVNETCKLSTKGLGKNLTFKSSKPKIASVTDKGLVKGLKKGTAQISILSGSKVKAKYTVKVVAAPKKVTLSAKAITLGVKESLTMTPTIPKNTHTTFTWTSKNNKIATVSKTGKITGKKAGETTVTVQTHNGKAATLKVVVKAAPKKVTLNKTSLTLELYDEFQLKATLPKGSVSNKLTWTSSDEDVVTVFEDGWLFANDIGTATITVKTYNGKKATCKVTVIGDEEEEDEEDEEDEPLISLNKTNINLSVGDTATVAVTYTGDGSIYWSTSTSGIVDCRWGDDWVRDTCELYITGKSVGSTVVTVEDRDAGYSASLNVTVTSSAGYTGDLLSAFGMDIDDVQYALDDALSYYKHDTENGQYLYTNNYMLVQVSDVTDRIEGIILGGKSSTSGKYTLCGVHPGMNFYTAQSEATKIGWRYSKTNGDYYYYTGRYNGENVYLGIKKVSGTSIVDNVYMWKA